ncbi:MAG: hypothetical protein SGJ24_14015 [Chloroflexota bacterium]|nr:hypothetical protein [Chloroflexota bacterium]
MYTLTLDYLLEGERRGYTFTPTPDSLPPETVKALWRGTMPRGQGWGEPVYAGARALKCFALPDGNAAICDVVTTDLRDEVGRAGIRRAQIAVGSAREVQSALSARLTALPTAIVQDAERRLNSREWALLFRKYRDAAKPRSLVKPQTILAYPYKSADSWTFIEACLLLLATRATLLTNLIEVDPIVNPFADRVLSFTTLALDHRDEGRIVALPLDRARTLPDVPYIDLSGK